MQLKDSHGGDSSYLNSISTSYIAPGSDIKPLMTYLGCAWTEPVHNPGIQTSNARSELLIQRWLHNYEYFCDQSTYKHVHAYGCICCGNRCHIIISIWIFLWLICACLLPDSSQTTLTSRNRTKAQLRSKNCPKHFKWWSTTETSVAVTKIRNSQSLIHITHVVSDTLDSVSSMIPFRVVINSQTWPAMCTIPWKLSQLCQALNHSHSQSPLAAVSSNATVRFCYHGYLVPASQGHKRQLARCYYNKWVLETNSSRSHSQNNHGDNSM